MRIRSILFVLALLVGPGGLPAAARDTVAPAPGDQRPVVVTANFWSAGAAIVIR